MTQSSDASVDLILDELFNHITVPNTVIDVGAGVGSWLKGCLKRGCQDVRAIEGEWVRTVDVQILKELYLVHNLEDPLPKMGKYDLAVCLEVAEHLSEGRAHSFVVDLTNLSDVVLFSAAIPGQGGTRHINERWQQYWADLFEEQSYACFDFIRPVIWDDPRIRVEYRQNILIYVRKDVAERLNLKREGPLMLNLIHPLISRTWGPGIAYSCRFLGKALKRRFNGGH
jgi:hypothetical protein